MFAVIRERDVLLHHPYDAFDPVVEFINARGRRPARARHQADALPHRRRLADRAALARAAENGKQVAAIVELKARFDEASNIRWARTLEQSGAQVIYGLLGLKTHAKALLVVRREKDGLRRYVHLSTGNYNRGTARLYTDLGLFTADPLIGEDVRRSSTCSRATARPRLEPPRRRAARPARGGARPHRARDRAGALRQKAEHRTRR
jgi:polyphosphate kinase